MEPHSYENSFSVFALDNPMGILRISGANCLQTGDMN